MGVPPTGKLVEIPIFLVYNLGANIIQRGGMYYDSATMARHSGS
jgi:hypothetical protein